MKSWRTRGVLPAPHLKSSLPHSIGGRNDRTGRFYPSWSGEEFWNEDWNKDIDFEEAFRTSCVWYFREVIDEIGKERMQEALDTLSYGNCDISDWEGRQIPIMTTAR